ncbi:hypothetical protein [Sphingomonas sp. URHD0057]|uniref:hypothetical protein n=1 Tax=Sphingomonas sp. URHD0057 TaxID=1380389 RepID=UPI00048F8688|nr:hypothetical protein [Sphingomonas sp. URHD0057]
MLRYATVLFFAVATAANSATDRLTIRAGESLTITIGDKGLAVLTREKAAPLSAFETEALHDGQAIVVPPEAKTVAPLAINHTDAPAPKIRMGQLRIAFRTVSNSDGTAMQSLLTLENGYARSLRYSAVIRRGEQSVPTDVCDVPAVKPGFEHWPYVLDAIDLSNFELLEGDQIECQ